MITTKVHIWPIVRYNYKIHNNEITFIFVRYICRYNENYFILLKETISVSTTKQKCYLLNISSTPATAWKNFDH